MTDQKQVLDILRKMAAKMEEQKEYLTELDRPIGDNDHGINMARGFAEVEKELPALEGKDIGGILQKTGMILLSALHAVLRTAVRIARIAQTKKITALPGASSFRILPEGSNVKISDIPTRRYTNG